MLGERPNELVRQDDGGDPWALEHRELGGGHEMIDLDGYQYAALSSEAPTDQLFAEYTCDSFANRLHIARNFALVALFDRKRTAHSLFYPSNLRCLQFYCWLCRQHARFQPCMPFFFYVIGEKPPWRMVQVDPNSGKPTDRSWLYSPGEWRDTWNRAGLAYQRKRLSQFLKSQANGVFWQPPDASEVLHTWQTWANSLSPPAATVLPAEGKVLGEWQGLLTDWDNNPPF